MRKYQIQHRCDKELAALEKTEKNKKKEEDLKRDRAEAVAATVKALRMLASKEMREKLEEADRHISGSRGNIEIEKEKNS